MHFLSIYILIEPIDDWRFKKNTCQKVIIIIIIIFHGKKNMGKGATWIGVKRLLWNQVFFKKKTMQKFK